MRSFAILTCASVAAAVALPQNIDFAAVDALPTPTILGAPIGGGKAVPTYNAAAAASAAAADAADGSISDNNSDNQKRAATTTCPSNPSGAGPTTTPDTASAFQQNQVYSNISSSAPTPQGYQLAFQSLNAATNQGGYLGYYTLNSYDTIKCQELCDTADGCSAINMYFERDPSQQPCYPGANPPSTVNIKCVLYGLPVSRFTATYTGAFVGGFQVAIAGSNGYNKNIPPPPQANFTGPIELGGAINAPDLSTYIGMSIFNGPYDPSQCAAACQAQTAYDQAHPRPDGSFDPCNAFNSYVLSDNNSPLGTYCSYYTRAWGKQYATNYGQYRGNDYYSVSSSYEYILSNQVNGSATQ